MALSPPGFFYAGHALCSKSFTFPQVFVAGRDMFYSKPPLSLFPSYPPALQILYRDVTDARTERNTSCSAVSTVPEKVYITEYVGVQPSRYGVAWCGLVCFGV